MFDREQMVAELGDSRTNQVVQRFQQFAFFPNTVIDSLADHALAEQWGASNYVLKKYLAVHVPWAIEQGHYTTSANQFYVRAGHLQTRYGTPLYLVFEANTAGHQQPYVLRQFRNHQKSQLQLKSSCSTNIFLAITPTVYHFSPALRP